MEYLFWLAVFVVFSGLELATLGLTCIWFAVGALAACIAAVLGANVVIQTVIFIVVTILVLIFIRPFAVKHINNKAEKTNVESLVGKTGKVITTINNINAKGMIEVDGVEWTARSEDGNVINEDELVTIVAIEGVKAIVKKVEV